MSDFQTHLQRALGADLLIERELGGGGMSRVFLATERALQRRVVVKVLPPELAAGVNIDRFRREIQLAAGLQHPHIVPLLATGESGDVLWFSMPYIEGESLRSALVKRERLPVRDVVRILHDVVDVLAHAHARGVVHRDIKPDNILLSGMHALVTDFGVAKALSAAIPLPGGTTTGMAIGTPAYMAPEQLAADPAADHRVDIYAVGLLAYELLTGRSPFSGGSPQATLAAQLTQSPEPPHRTFTDIPEVLSAIIMHCLEKDAARRPQTAAQLLAELDALPPLSSGAAIPVARPRSWRRRAAAGVAAMLLLVVAVLFATTRDDRRASRSRRSAPPQDARDAGPGGSRTPSMEVGANGSATRPDSAASGAVRDPALSDAPPSTVLPIVLTRDDSLKIAAIVAREFAADRAANASTSPAPTGSAPAATTGATTNTATAATNAGTGAAPGPGVTVNPGSPAAAGAPVPAVPAVVGVAAAQGGRSGQSFRIVTGDRHDTVGVETRIVMRPPPGARGVDGSTALGFSPDVQLRYLREIDRVFTDSMRRAMQHMNPAVAARLDSTLRRLPFIDGSRAFNAEPAHMAPMILPNADGRIRVVVANYRDGTANRSMQKASADVAAFIRQKLPVDRFEVISEEVTEQARRRSRRGGELGWLLRADFVVSGLVMNKRDAIVVQTLLVDVHNGRNAHQAEVPIDPAAPQSAFESTLSRVTEWLQRAEMKG